MSTTTELIDAYLAANSDSSDPYRYAFEKGMLVVMLASLIDGYQAPQEMRDAMQKYLAGEAK